MAVGLRGLFRLSSLTNSLLPKTNFINAGIRFLYTELHLGIKSYENTRYVFRNQFVSIEETFRSKMKDICEENDGVIYTEDMKAMIHLIQANDKDLQLISDMLLKYNKGVKEKQVAQYAFGPIVMRMLYFLNQPAVALSMYTNDEYQPMFNYHTAFKILLCLLLKNHMYQETIDIFFKELNEKGISHCMSLSTLMFAACYKLNTEEAVETAWNFWQTYSKERYFSVRGIGIMAYLAIKHNKAAQALEVLSTTKNENILSHRNLKLLANTHLERYLHIIPLLKSSSELDTPYRHLYFSEIVYYLEEKLGKEDVKERDEILFLLNKLRLQNQIESEKTLEMILFAPLVIKDRRNMGRSETNKYASKDNKTSNLDSVSAFN